MKKENDIIDEIVHRLKSKTDFSYREGAWERFRKIEKAENTNSGHSLFFKYISIAATLLIGFLAYFMFVKNNYQTFDDSLGKIVKSDNTLDVLREETSGKTYSQEVEDEMEVEKYSDSRLTKLKGEDFEKAQLASVDIVQNNMISERTLIAHEIAKKDIEKIEQSLIINIQKKNLPPVYSTLASTHSGNIGRQTHYLKSNSSNSNVWKLQDKFDFGIFVSPYSQSEAFKVGAGFTMAYKINNKLSLRTGASYNTYEVGILKNPLASSSVEEVNAKVSNAGLQSNGQNAATSVSKLTVPNINAITGFVNSIEIPLEVKYNLNKSLYATAGFSYSTIISQERNAIYIENIDNITFKNGFPDNEKQANQALQIVTRTIKSSEDNVNPNKYSGFINLSFGKKVNINRKFGLSVEPFYKIPIGEYRRSDMSYSNGGVRVITNF